MKAMILAAGYGSRLGEMGRTRPKCLLEVGGRSMLEHVIASLQKAGVDSLTINTHHLAAQVEAFVAERQQFGMQVRLSYEPEILGTGGGLLNAKSSFEHEPEFFMHNADVYSEFDLQRLLAVHRKHGALATLAVLKNECSRPLFFNGDSELKGWRSADGEKLLSPLDGLTACGFSGIQVISPRAFNYMPAGEKEFSIIGVYMRAAAAGERVMACPMGDSYWIDAGTPERVTALRERLSGSATAEK